MLFIGVWIVVLGTLPAWGATLYKLFPAYRDGRLAGKYRAAFHVLIALLSWYTLIVFVVFFGGDMAMGVMVSVLFAIGALTWAAVGTINGTRRTVRMEHETKRAAKRQGRQPAMDGWTVRTQPQPVTVQATERPRSRRVRDIERMGKVEA